DTAVGLGAGRAATAFVRALAARVGDGLRVRGVPVSEATAELARELGIPLVGLEADIDVTVDGADEVDPDLNLIKGYGGALVRELDRQGGSPGPSARRRRAWNYRSPGSSTGGSDGRPDTDAAPRSREARAEDARGVGGSGESASPLGARRQPLDERRRSELARLARDRRGPGEPHRPPPPRGRRRRA